MDKRPPLVYLFWIALHILLIGGALWVKLSGGFLPYASWGFYYGATGIGIGRAIDVLFLLLSLIIIVGTTYRKSYALYASYAYVLLAISLRTIGSIMRFRWGPLLMIGVFIILGLWIWKERAYLTSSSKPI